jgi:hypothetical protein
MEMHDEWRERVKLDRLNYLNNLKLKEYEEFKKKKRYYTDDERELLKKIQILIHTSLTKNHFTMKTNIVNI